MEKTKRLRKAKRPETKGFLSHSLLAQDSVGFKKKEIGKSYFRGATDASSENYSHSKSTKFFFNKTSELLRKSKFAKFSAQNQQKDVQRASNSPCHELAVFCRSTFGVKKAMKTIIGPNTDKKCGKRDVLAVVAEKVQEAQWHYAKICQKQAQKKLVDSILNNFDSETH